MSNFRLKVFYAVSMHLSFTKAAQELFITQPAVTKNIKELEQEYDCRFFNRNGSNISLTESGKTLLEYTKEILALEKELKFKLSSLQQKYSGEFRIGASTTIGQYILPAILARFNKKYPEIKLSLISHNTERIEQALLEERVDFAIIEGSTKNKRIKYIPFIKDEIVAIADTSQALSEKEEIDLKELCSIPVVLRENGSGSLEIIINKLREHNHKLNDLNILMHLGSTESIKSFLSQSNSLGLTSINSVNKEIATGKFKIIDIKDFVIERWFYFIHPQGKLSGISEVFMQFSQQHYNQKL